MRGLITGFLIVLVGCSGIEPGKDYPSESFTVAQTYQEVYRRAQLHGRECLSTFNVDGDLYTDNRTGVVRVSIPKFMYTGRESLKIDISDQDGKTAVTATVDGVGVFNQAQLRSVRETIESGTPRCR